MTKNIFFDKKELKYCGKNVIIGKTTRIRQPELVSIGDGSIIDDFCYISGELEIGSYVHIGASCTLQASKGRIMIADFSGISSGTRIFAASSDYINLSFDMPTVPQEMMYGGIVFVSDRLFCGLFVRKEHITVEFDRGAKMDDPNGFLEGGGNNRRHLKIHDYDDIKQKQAEFYITQSSELHD